MIKTRLFPTVKIFSKKTNFLCDFKQNKAISDISGNASKHHICQICSYFFMIFHIDSWTGLCLVRRLETINLISVCPKIWELR